MPYPDNPIGFPGLGISLNPSQAAFSVAGRDIYWYGILIALAFLLAAFYVMKRAPQAGIASDNIIDTLFCAVPSAIIFARLYYVLFNLSEFQVSADNPNPAKIYEIWKGGIAIYGAIIGGVLAAWIFCRIRKVRFSAMMDVVSLGLLIGQAIGRWGNFFNREAFGAVTDVPWRMEVFVSSINGQVFEQRMAVHPTFLYEFLWCLAGFLLLHFFFKKRRFNGQIALMYVAWYGLGRSFIEGLRADSLFVGATNLRVSQLLAVVSCLVALGLLAYHLFFKEHDPSELLAPITAAAGEGVSEGAALEGEALPGDGIAADAEDLGEFDAPEDLDSLKDFEALEGIETAEASDDSDDSDDSEGEDGQ
ncbi:MAG: prolipoprotein diacylglyceryl transferase [Oscillospiraceae bacterium]|jgi:phosphatidylglycerol:prolipoprotein diacylglycerol transferase|nr:prolipoprotein diacylglyceryl transferase [Oscillospiraceae bacterium]